jgi:hypothetical protein
LFATVATLFFVPAVFNLIHDRRMQKKLGVLAEQPEPVHKGDKPHGRR